MPSLLTLATLLGQEIWSPSINSMQKYQNDQESHVVPESRESALRWLFLATALHGLVYLLLLPPWMGEDEPWHVEYSLDLALATEKSRSSLPTSEALAAATPSQRKIQERTGADLADVRDVQARIVQSMQHRDFWQRIDFAGWGPGANDLDRFSLGHSEAQQPPLYYGLCAFLLELSGLDKIESQLSLLRVFSFLMYLAVLGFTYALARQVSRDIWLPALATLLVAWLPMHARQSAVVSNDVLVKVFTSATLWLLAQNLIRPLPAPKALALPVLIFLAMSTKLTAIGIAAPLCLVLFYSSIRRRGPLVGSVQGILVLVLLFGALLWWQSDQTGPRDTLDGMGLPTNSHELELHLKRVLSANYWSEFANTFTGSFNWYSRDLPPLMVNLLMAMIGIGLLSSLLLLRRSSDKRGRIVLAMCWLALVCQLVAMTTRGFSAGRFLFPVLPALMTLVAAGWLVLVPDSRKRALTLSLAMSLVVYDGFALWNGLFVHQYQDWGS